MVSAHLLHESLVQVPLLRVQLLLEHYDQVLVLSECGDDGGWQSQRGCG